ncbi:MAG: nuclear transport factor 2 family protein [Saonia sp.]
MKKLIFLALIPFCFPLYGQPNTEVHLFDIAYTNGLPVLENPRNISNNEGYDNQPSFYNDHTVLFSSTRDDQTDILRFNIREGSTTAWITDTPSGSEYSPLRIPNEDHISAIRLDINGLQRLYTYDITSGASEVLLKDLKVGYHVWYTRDILVSSVLMGNRMDLVVSNLLDGTHITHQKKVGRSLQKIPNSDLISYISKETDIWELKSLNPVTGATQVICTLENMEDICWLPDGTLIAGKGKKLMKFNPKKDTEWKVLQTFTDENINNITRLAVNGQATRLTFVAEVSPAIIVQKQLDAYNARDIDAFMATYSENIKLFNFPNKLFSEGQEKMRESYAGFFESTPDLNCEIKNRIVIGNKVIDEEYLTINGTNFSAVAIYEVENGKISKVTFVQ